jgi:hypothetical protein
VVRLFSRIKVKTREWRVANRERYKLFEKAQLEGFGRCTD